jgi:NAD(P) transhydrogenase subunit alpha
MLEVVDAMKPGAILICFIYAGKEAALVQRLLDKKITCFAMERLPRISRAQAMDALSSQSALAGYYAVQLGSTHWPHPAQDDHGRRRDRAGARCW